MNWTDVMLPNYPTPTLQLARGEGAHVWDAAGQRYLDLLAGIAVNALGHAHPDIVRAVREQIGTLGHTSNLYANGPGLRLAEQLQKTLSEHGRYRVVFQNSGTEANEAALKLARRHAHQEGMPQAVVLAFDKSFHGRTYGGLTLTGQAKYHDRLHPLLAQILHVPFNDPGALETAFADQQVAAVFFESIQGEGGVIPMTADTARALARLAKAHGTLLVADEIQTGVARTGRFYGFEHEGLTPDVVTLAKGLGGGLPLGATLVRSPHDALFTPGSHGTTFGGNPVACAAGSAVLDTVERQGLVARAARLGSALASACDQHGLARRGLGLLQGVLVAPGRAGAVVSRMQEARILVGQAGPDVVRLAPPLIVEERDLLGAIPTLAEMVRAEATTPPKT